MTKTEEVIQALRRRGPSTCEELAAITTMGADAISAMFREFMRNKKYGAVIVGEIRMHGASGNARKLVAIDEGEYADYLAKRKAREAERAKRFEQRQAPSRRQIVIPASQYRTQWQPASPYYQEAA